MNYLLVGVGGALGSFIRFSLGKMISKKAKTVFPLATFIINITGAFLLGVVSTIGLMENIYTLLSEGFLGAYTTFSTFMYEGFNLFAEKKKTNAFIYILASIFIGVAGFIMGVHIADTVNLW